MKKRDLTPQMAAKNVRPSLPLALSNPQVGIKHDDTVDADKVETKYQNDWNIWSN